MWVNDKPVDVEIEDDNTLSMTSTDSMHSYV